MEGTAKLVRQIAEIAYQKTTVWSKQDWIRRKWIAVDVSQVSRTKSYIFKDMGTRIYIKMFY